jgi:hypothetical protein
VLAEYPPQHEMVHTRTHLFEAGGALTQRGLFRGILSLSETQRNPGPGQKRLYSRLDAARIVVINSLTDRGMSASAMRPG